MTSKLKIKIIIDILMTFLLPTLMAYMLIGQKVHECIGAVMFALFIIHNILNFKWYLNVFRGKYTPQRMLKTGINIMVFVTMLGLMISGIMMSRYVFSFLAIDRGMGFARKLHMLSAYWGFAFMSLHLGIHAKMIKSIAFGAHSSKGRYKAVFSMLAILVSTYGVYAFIKNDILSYMFLKSMFVFFDSDQSVILFFTEYISMMMLFACIGYYLTMPLQIYAHKRTRTR